MNMLKDINIKKFLRIFLCISVIIILIGAILVLAVNLYVTEKTKDRILTADSIEADEIYDCILVLGCGVYPDGTPSAMLTDRLRRAVELYDQKAAPKIIMSGDHGRATYDEVNIMRAYAMEHGVPDEDIFMDHAGFSTYESMYRAKEIFGVEKMLIVTQEYHLYRALYIADSLGIEANGVAADYRLYAGQEYRNIREYAARVKDFCTCVIKPEPTFLGEKIPVSGDGNATVG